MILREPSNNAHRTCEAASHMAVVRSCAFPQMKVCVFRYKHIRATHHYNNHSAKIAYMGRLPRGAGGTCQHPNVSLSDVGFDPMMSVHRCPAAKTPDRLAEAA